ncbi:MAG TPA: protein phosphatase 2C domain-containing protein [Gemmatimonadales bacterium]|nr:protein phosphatase 2C domain-containing protein [Gemmatimonadales bacterium]
MTKPVRVSVFGKTDLGKTRDHNEDSFLVADLTTKQASLLPEVRDHVVGPRGSLFMVADGMGGAAAGEVASAMATDLIYKHLTNEWGKDAEVSAQRFAYRMKEAVEVANAGINGYTRDHPEVRGMGTTCTTAGVFGTDLYLCQIGDSRGYLVRDGKTMQITKDQSLMQRLVDAGELTEAEAETSERRNIILQALGPEPRVKVDLTHQPLRKGDLLVLCSDGLSGQVKRDEIGELAAKHPGLPELCSALIDLANERGGPDNITCIAARFDGEGLEASDGSAGVGHQVYPLDDHESTTEPVPVYKGSPAPKPLAEQKKAVTEGGDQRKLGLVLLLIALGAALAVYYLTGAA